MIPTLLASFLFVLLLSVITTYGYRAYVRPSRIYDRVGGTAETNPEDHVTPKEQVARIFEQVGDKITLSPGEQTAVRRDLTMAGFRDDSATSIFYGTKVFAAVAFFALAFLARNAVSDAVMLRIVFMVGATGFGYYFPTLFLEKMVKERQTKLKISLPDALDMMVVSVEAGLGLDQALQYVGREISGRTHGAG